MRLGLALQRTAQAADRRADQVESVNQRLRLRVAAHHPDHQAQLADLQAESIRRKPSLAER